jgi:hypothetical protein
MGKGVECVEGSAIFSKFWNVHKAEVVARLWARGLKVEGLAICSRFWNVHKAEDVSRLWVRGLRV